MNKKIVSVGMLVLAGIVWGASFVAVKDSLDYVTPLWQLALRLAIAAVLAVIWGICMRKSFTRKGVKKGICLGILFFCALLFQNEGAQWTTASKTSFLTDSYVAFIPVIEIVLLHKKLPGKRILAAVLCMIGVGFLTLNGSLHLQAGDVLILVCGLFYAFHIIYIDSCTEENPIILHIVQIITAAILAIAAALLFEPIPDALNNRCVGSLLYCGIFEILLGFFFQIAGQKNLSASLSGILLSMECVYAAIFAVILMGDKMTVPMLVGGCLMLGAAVLDSVA